MSFERHVYAVQRYVEFTDARYAQLFKPGVEVHPICCFGDVTNATIVTVGVNPSVAEFENGRWEEGSLDHKKLAARCRDYFSSRAPVPHHPWFDPWKQALASLGASYETGEAVHIDFSPRATKFIRDLKEAFEQELFLEMVERDIWTFFATLALCPKARLIMMAGSVTGRYYINEFLQRLSPNYGYAICGAFNRLHHSGKAKVCWHELTNSSQRLPVFFCSSSPAANDPDLLPLRVRENSAQIKTRLR